MPIRPASELAVLLRRALLCWIAVALAVQGSTAALVQMLGPSHRHEVRPLHTAAGLLDRIDGVFRDVRAWRAELHRQLLPHERPHVHADGDVPAHGPEHDSDHAHAHSSLQRHHHAHGDSSVIALDGSQDAAADATAQAGAGSVTLPLALPFAWDMPLPAGRWTAWPATSTHRWADAPRRASERPPRT